MFVMVFRQVCVKGGGGAPLLFMCCLSQDWTFVRVNSLSAGQSGQHFLLALHPVIGPAVRHSSSWFVSASHSLSSENLVSNSLSRFSFIRLNAMPGKIFFQGSQSVGMKCFEVEALSELNTHPPSISLHFLVFFVWLVTPALLSKRYFNSLRILEAFAKVFCNVLYFWFFF